MSALDTITKVYAAYAQGDMDTGLALCSEDICFSWPVDGRLSSRAGDTTGVSAMRERLVELQTTYEFQSFRPFVIVADDERVAARVAMELKHRNTGRVLKIENAHFWTVRDGRVVELVEYYDTALIRESERD
jgi:ketosteroid isomerase-like protein